jgi:putative redox protein
MSDEPMRADLVWNGGLQFTAQTGAHALRLDGDQEAAGSPMEALLASLAGCMAIDLVIILGKRRAELKSLRAHAEGTRAEAPPRRFVGIALHFEIAGTGLKAADVDRAIQLSREKYCSVFTTLRSDIDVRITYGLAER